MSISLTRPVDGVSLDLAPPVAGLSLTRSG
jgi:hypothetical protein